MKKNEKKRKKGFTLVELIVVIAILGILAAVAVPRMAGYRQNAQDSTNKATARTIMSAYTAAEAEAGGTPTVDNVNKYLDNSVTVVNIVTTKPGTSNTGWYIYLNGTNKSIEIYKDGEQKLP